MNKDNRYETFRDQSEEDEKTLLHYAAEQNFYHVARTLIRFCPGLLALKTESVLTPVKKRALLPVEVALNENNDEAAAVMLRHMSHERYKVHFTIKYISLNNMIMIERHVYTLLRSISRKRVP